MRFRSRDASSMMRLPISVEPVNETLLNQRMRDQGVANC